MLQQLKRDAANWSTSLVHLGLLAMGARINTHTAWMWTLSAVAALGFIAWCVNFRRYRLIDDTPTSRITSAAQGYVELVGHAEHAAQTPILSKLTALPCAWYRYWIESKSGDKWSFEEGGESEDPFLLVDQSGQCLIYPEDAEVITTRKEVWQKGEYRYTELLLLLKDRLYAIGEFRTVGGAASDLNTSADLSALLGQWKADTPRLLERFDLNRDGQIDLKEWQLARMQAKREVDARHSEIRGTPGTHTLRKPKDGRLFLLSNLAPHALARKYAVWALVHLAVLALAVGIAIFVTA